MAFLFAESFDHYAIADIAKKWTQEIGAGGNPLITYSFAGGRRGTAGWNIAVANGGPNAGFSKALAIVPSVPGASGATFICGFSFSQTNAANVVATTNEVAPTGNSIFKVRLAGTTQVWFRLNTDGTISAYRSTTLLGTTAAALSNGTSYYIEAKVVINSSSGSIQIRINGALQLNLSSINTQGAASAAWNEFIIGPIYATINQSHVWNYDDIYLLDGSGSTSNDFIGDVRIDVVFPDADGNSSQFSLSTGATHFANVDENPPNSDTDYNFSSTVNQKDTLNFPNAPVAGVDVYAVQVNMLSRKTDAGSAGIKSVVRMGGTDYLGSEVAIPSTYSYARNIWDRRPSDSAVWTTPDFDAAEFGYIKSS